MASNLSSKILILLLHKCRYLLCYLVSIHLSETSSLGPAFLLPTRRFSYWMETPFGDGIVWKYQCANVLVCQCLTEAQLFLSDIVNLFTRKHDKFTIFMATKEPTCKKWNSSIELQTCDSSLENIYNFQYCSSKSSFTSTLGKSSFTSTLGIYDASFCQHLVR